MIAHDLAALRRWARSKPDDVRDLAVIVCVQIAILKHLPSHEALHTTVTENIARLRLA